MTSSAIIPTFDRVPDRVSDDVAARIASSTASNTKRAYRSDWTDFSEWCNDAGRESLPATPQTVAEYIDAAAKKGLKVSTIKRRLVAISAAHEASGHDTPTRTMVVRKTMQGIRRDNTKAVAKKHAVSLKELHMMCDAIPQTLDGIRDRAILTVSFSGAFRRSEVSALTTADLKFGAGEVVVTLPRSKTDQEGEGMTKVLSMSDLVAIDPVRSLREWMKAARIYTGPVFRAIDKHGLPGRKRLSGQSIAAVWKRAAARVGLEPKEIAGHSARRGFITEAYNAELPEADIMQHTGHKSPVVMRGYRADSGVASRRVSRIVLNR